LTTSALALESANYRGTRGVSENNRCAGFLPAYIDRQSGIVHLSRFADGRRAPCHLLDGLPHELVIARDKAVAMLASASRFDASRDPDASLRGAA
jgi:hypothetical protein